MLYIPFNLLLRCQTTMLRQFAIVLSTIIMSIYASLGSLYLSSYGYGVLYDYYNINETISIYAPQNKYKHHFENTNKIEHVRLFDRIVYSVHHQGKGLEDIHYYAPNKEALGARNLGKLLTKAEVIHLQDVAALLTLINKFFFIFLALFICLIFNQKKRLQKKYTKDRSILAGVLSVVTTLSIILLLGIFGAKTVFYKLHTYIFPNDHQWFFYYQDSLMSTLMQAPNLFAGIAFFMSMIALLYFFILTHLLQRKVEKDKTQ
jgi:uncharacterized membrane protein